MLGVEGEFGVIPSEAREQVFDIWNVTYRAHLVAQFRAEDPANKLDPVRARSAAARSQVVDRRRRTTDIDREGHRRGALPRRRREVPRRQRLGPARSTRACCSRRAATGRRLHAGLRGAALDLQGVRPQEGREGRRAAAGRRRSGQGRHRRRRRQVPERGRGQGRLPGRRRLPRPRQRRRRRRRRGRQVRDRARGQGRLPGRGRLPRSRQRRRRHPRRGRTSARTRPRTRTASRTTTAAPIRTTTATACSTPQDKCPDQPETKNGFQDEDGCPDEIPAKLKQFTGVDPGHQLQGGDAALLPDVEQDARQGRRGAQGVPGPQARDRGPHRRPADQEGRASSPTTRRCRRRAPSR